MEQKEAFCFLSARDMLWNRLEEREFGSPWGREAVCFLQAAKRNYAARPEFPTPGKYSPTHIRQEVGKDQRRKKEQSREISHCSLLSLPSLAAFCLEKRKRVPELVCNKDHPPFQKQGGKDSAQVPHTEGCEQGLKINMLKPGVKRPPQLDDLLERKRPQVSSCCLPIVWQARTQQVFSQLTSLTDYAGEHHTALSPQTQSFQRPATNPASRWRQSRVRSNGHSMRPTTSSPHWIEDRELFIRRKTSLCPAMSVFQPFWHSSSRLAWSLSDLHSYFYSYDLFIFLLQESACLTYWL